MGHRSHEEARRAVGDLALLWPAGVLPVDETQKWDLYYSVLTAQGSRITVAGNANLTIGADTSTSQVVQVASAGDPGNTSVPVNTFTANATYPVGTPVALPGEGYLAVQVDGESGSAPSDVSQVTVQIQNTATGSAATVLHP